jgi:hypothetical protein
VRKLPPTGGLRQYRIESNQDGRKRLAIEHQLRPAL